MLFSLENRPKGNKTHCGVLEFIAEEGMIYMPYWVGSPICCPDRTSLADSCAYPIHMQPAHGGYCSCPARACSNLCSKFSTSSY